MTEAFTTVLEERTQNNIVRIRVNEMILFKPVVNKLPASSGILNH